MNPHVLANFNEDHAIIAAYLLLLLHHLYNVH